MKTCLSRIVGISTVLLALIGGEAAHAGCANVEPENMTSAAGKSKCTDLPENSCQVSSPPRYYLQETVLNHTSCDPGWYDDSYTITYYHMSCLWSSTETINGNSQGTAFESTVTVDTNGNETASGDSTLRGQVDGSAAGILGDCMYFGYFDTNGSCSSMNESFYGFGSCTVPTGFSFEVTETGTATLSSEYTDDMLRNDMISLLPPYPTNWSVGAGSAYYVLTSDHVSASGAKMKYRFQVTDCIKNQRYVVTWDEVTTYPNSSQAPSINHLMEKVTGSGDPSVGVYTSVHEIPVPAQPSTITLANWNVTLDSSGGGGPGGGGSGGGPGSGGSSFGNGGSSSGGSGSSGCSTCGGTGSGSSSGNNPGPNFSLSMGNAQYGQSAGDLTLGSTAPDPTLFTPVSLQFDAPMRTDVNLITTSQVTTQSITNGFEVNETLLISTNVSYDTNGTDITTNWAYVPSVVTTTNPVVTTAYTTNAVILQVQAPQAIADVPTPPTANGYVVNYYYPTNVIGTNLNGTFQFSGSPFISWLVTNSNPSANFQLQVSEYGINPNYGLMKQWTYTYATNTGTWSVQPLGGTIQENITLTNLSANVYQIIDTVQSPSGPVVQQAVSTYQVFSWSQNTNVALVQTALGSSSAPEITTNTYWDPTYFGGNSLVLLQSAVHPDGSWEYYNSYDANGNPTVVYSSFEDAAVGSTSARETDYAYGAGYGDDGTLNTNTPRLVIGKIQSIETSRSYTLYPSVGVRLDIRCTAAGASWNSTGNLITTNLFYTNGPNQFALQAVIRPDGTMTTYNYITNGTYQTNITVTGQPGSGFTGIVDGISNQTVLNQWGYMVYNFSQDVISGLTLAQDVYGNFDSYGRPQMVTHLDGTSNLTYYACCGLENTVNPDGVNTVYLYDAAHRQIGYETFYSSSTNNYITRQNTLDAAGRNLQSFRIGSDGSSITLSQSAYDLAGELIAQTNALNGVTTYSRANDPTTGGLIRTTTYPNTGIVTNLYYADGSLKKTIGTAVHGVRYQYGTGTDVNGNTCTYTEEIKLNNGSDTSETTTTYADMAGRTTEILYSDGHYSQSFYNSLGQLWKQIDPDGVTTQYQYNAKGEMAFTIIDPSGADRITQSTNDVITDHGTTVSRNRRYVWLDGASSGTLVSYTEASSDGLNIWQTQYRDTSTSVTNHSQTVPGSSRTVTITVPDGSYTVNTYSYSRLASSTRYDSGNNQIASTSYGYDPQGRQNTMTDARNGTTTLVFNNADLVATNTTPNPGGGSPESTIAAYNNMLQATTVTQPDGTTISSAYLFTGELGMQYGSRTYPVGYSYDYAGRMQTMTNWSNFSGLSGARVMSWNYDAYRGWLTGKTYADGHGPSYSYTSAGRLASRAWVRGITTSYAYNTAGSLTNISYSDSTPWVTNSYDRLGRLSYVSCNGMTDALTYNLANELLSESFSGGILANLSVTNGYDADLRRSTLAALASGSPLSTTTYGYDKASRLSSVSDGNGNSAAYSYLANSPLVGQIMFTNGTTWRMTTTKQYDYLNRLTQISSAPSASYTLPLTFNYNYNPANQRTKDTLADGSYWIYAYDSLGQVTNACKYFADNTPVAGQQFDYTFDTIGNRTQTQAGGDSTGANLRTANFSANNLNQITQRDVPGYVNVTGASILTNSVTVAGQTAYRKEEYFQKELWASNSLSPLWTNIIVSGGLSTTGNVYVAQTPEHFSYDADGNLTNDGRWAYTWDGENRLKTMTVNTNIGPQYQLTFAYDAKGRRIQKVVTTNGVAYSTNNFLYDGWNLIAETKPNNSLIRSYVWGTDLSGTSQGAGGVGGLLEISYYGSSTTNCFLAYDGNGNVAALINAADGTLVANYDYGAFGEPIRITGVMARNNPFRFSTKYADDESDLLYYGHRYYKPSTGTWPNRDPINELGFQTLNYNRQVSGREQKKNLYCFVSSDSIDLIDLFGLDDYSPIPTPANNNSGKDIESHCAKCKFGLTCVDKEDLKRGIQKAEQDLEGLANEKFDSWNDFINALAADGDQAVGQTSGLLNGSLTDAGKKQLTDGQQCIIGYFESTAFTSKSGNHDHLPPNYGQGDISDYISEWIPAEESRLQDAIAELANAESLEGCPSYGPAKK